MGQYSEAELATFKQCMIESFILGAAMGLVHSHERTTQDWINEAEQTADSLINGYLNV